MVLHEENEFTYFIHSIRFVMCNFLCLKQQISVNVLRTNFAMDECVKLFNLVLELFLLGDLAFVCMLPFFDFEVARRVLIRNMVQ